MKKLTSNVFIQSWLYQFLTLTSYARLGRFITQIVYYLLRRGSYPKFTFKARQFTFVLTFSLFLDVTFVANEQY